MSDLMAVGTIISIALAGIIWSIERLIKVLKGGQVRIQNHIMITVRHPKDISVTLENNINKEINK